MVENKILKATSKIVAALDTLESEERMRAVQAALNILGEGEVPIQTSDDSSGSGGESADTSGGGSMTAKEYFDAKKPKTKGEELATAARYREESVNAVSSSKEEIRSVTSDARRNFDSRNYARDIGNARIKGFFNRETGKDSAVLSHYGQSYIDALPDHEAARALTKPKRSRARKKKISKKKTKKKVAKKK